MAAALVNNGAIDEKMFNDANGEHLVVFAKVEPFVTEFRNRSQLPAWLQQLEQLVMRQPEMKSRLAAIRERFRLIAATRAGVART
jgi:hypothetical protein